MQIKTSDGGTSNVASQGLGVWGAVGGGLGTLALLNQGFLGGNGIFGNRHNGCGCHQDNDTRQISALESKIAKLESERYTDSVGIDLYKEIVAKNKANRLNNTALLDEAGELIEGISKLATYVAKKPIDNADLIEPVNKLCLYVYDNSKYRSQRTIRDNGYYSGVNGLLPMIAKYTQLLRNVQKTGGLDYQRKELEDVQKAMKNTISIIKDILTTYDIDLKKIKS